MAQRGRFGIQALLALVATGAGFAAVAFAATHAKPPPDARPPHPRRQGQAALKRPPRPRIATRPEAETTSMKARFTFDDRQAGVRFECRIDRGRWRRCRSPVVTRVAPGRHTFSVRARNRRDVDGPAATVRWTRLQAKAFAIVPDLSGLGELFPGAPPVALPLTIENPNAEPISVTALRVTAVGGPTGCTGADNLAVGQSNVSAATPLRIPGGASVQLPSHGIEPPTIQLRDLPINQDACQYGRFPLEFSGSARG